MGGKAHYRRPLAEFTAALQELRQRAGNPTLRTMARRGKNKVSVTTLHEVDSGLRIPSLPSVEGYVTACDGDLELWRRQHRDLLTAVRLGGKPTFVPWRNYFDGKLSVRISDAKGLRCELRRLRLGSGLTYQQIAERTKHPHIVEMTEIAGLAASTVGDLCNLDRTHVPRRQTLHAFLLALGAPPSHIEQWLAVRNQLAVRQDRLKQLRLLRTSGDRQASQSVNRYPASGPRPVATAMEDHQKAGKMQLDPITRFRRLRNELAHQNFASQVRITDVLIGVGVHPTSAQKLAGDQGVAIAFVMRLDEEMHRIMSEGLVTNKGAAVALELALHRTTAKFRPYLESPSDQPRELVLE